MAASSTDQVQCEHKSCGRWVSSHAGGSGSWVRPCPQDSNHDFKDWFALIRLFNSSSADATPGSAVLRHAVPGGGGRTKQRRESVARLSHTPDPRPPLRILALDGGGIRGLMEVLLLKELLQRCNQKSGKPDGVLADYFDLMAGTSTGGLIALASGVLRMPLEELEEL